MPNFTLGTPSGGSGAGTPGPRGLAGGILLRYDDLPSTSPQRAGWVPLFTKTVTVGTQGNTNGFILGSIGAITGGTYSNRDGNNVEIADIYHDNNGAGNGFVSLQLEVDDDRVLENTAPQNALLATDPTARFVAVIGGTSFELIPDVTELNGAVTNLEGKIWHWRTSTGIDVENPFADATQTTEVTLYIVSETTETAAALTDIGGGVMRSWYDLFEVRTPNGFDEAAAPPFTSGRLWQAQAPAVGGARSGRWSVAPFTGERGEGGGQTSNRFVRVPPRQWRRATTINNRDHAATDLTGAVFYEFDNSLLVADATGTPRPRRAVPILTGPNAEDFMEISQEFENSDLSLTASIKTVPLAQALSEIEIDGSNVERQDGLYTLHYWDSTGTERGVSSWNRAFVPGGNRQQDVSFPIWLTNEQKTTLSDGTQGWKFSVKLGGQYFTPDPVSGGTFNRNTEALVVSPSQFWPIRTDGGTIHGDEYYVREISRDAVVNEGSGQTAAATGGSGFETLSEINALVPNITFTQATQGLPNGAANDPSELPVILSAPQAGDILNLSLDFEGNGTGGGQFYINRVRNSQTHSINSTLNALSVTTNATVAVNLNTDTAEVQTDGSYLWRLVIGSHTSGAISTPSIAITGTIRRALSTAATPFAYRPRRTTDLFFPYSGDPFLGVPIPLEFPGNLDAEQIVVMQLESLQSNGQGANFPRWSVVIAAEHLKPLVAVPADLNNGVLATDTIDDLNFTHDRWFFGSGNNSEIIAGLRFYNASGEPDAYTHIVITRNVRTSPFTRPVIRTIGAY